MKTFRKILWGVFFIGAALLVIMYQLGYFNVDALTSVGLWGFVLSLIFVPVIIESFAHLNFAGVFIPLALIAIIYARPLGIESIVPWTVIIAALFLSIGFSILFKRYPFKNKWEHHHFDPDEFEKNIEYLKDNESNTHVSFGASSKYLTSENLERASFTCSFGALKVFFDNATLSPDGATVYVDCSFGSIQMYIPRSWKVISDISVTLGGVEEKNKHIVDSSESVLTLTGKVSLGAIEIFYL